MTATTRTVVIVEDDPDVGAVLHEVFTSIEVPVVMVDPDADVIGTVRELNPAITMLNTDSPGGDRLDVVRRIREVSDTYILLILNHPDDADTARWLAEGADGFATTPFRPAELRARIEAVLRRLGASEGGDSRSADLPSVPRDSGGASIARHSAVAARNPVAEAGLASLGDDDAEDWMRHRELAVNLRTRTVLVEQTEVELEAPEFELLATLMQSKRRVRSTSDLALVLGGQLPAAWYEVDDAEKRAVDERINQLRIALGDVGVETRYIESVEGTGYRLTAS